MSKPDLIIVTIDGGAATGKSSTAKALSERFNLLHVDTGAFYRTVTLGLLREGVSSDEPASVEEKLSNLNIGTRVSGRDALMELDGEVSGDAIRSADVNRNVSKFAAQESVRSFLYRYQRNQTDVARSHHFPGLVMEGRDIGSVIFPDADFRFFLQADEEERLRRRAGQGGDDEIRQRDQMDTQRKTAPLICPSDAITINSTRLSLNEVVEEISRVVETKLPRVFK